MALVTCPECHGAVSTSAASCPHCGFSPNGPRQGPPVVQLQQQGGGSKFFDPYANAGGCLRGIVYIGAGIIAFLFILGMIGKIR